MGRLYLLIFTIMFFAIVTIPLSVIEIDTEKYEKITISTTNSTASTKKSKDKEVYIYMSDDKKIKKTSISEYLLGVVLTEMDGSYPDEALKAQAVAAHTLLEFRKQENKNKKYDITDDYSIDQGYMNYKKRKAKYGDELKALEMRVKPLILEVKNKLIYYNNKPILAVYHDTSGGKTENCKDIWGGDYPYLKSVDSISDLLNPAYLSTVTYTKHEFSAKLKKLKITLPKNLNSFIGDIKTTNSGTVKSIVLGKKTFTGVQIRSAFSLRSANFDLKLIDDKFTFTVRGYGHGVGMSQYGASVLAKEGSDYKSILKYYYTGVEIKG
ncbi:MAG: stage II sporulation protein D [Clostridia bacterium]|nr:stage II sporulation protein D [Clostridia bacterium]